MAKKITYATEAHRKLSEGVESAARVLRVTLGPTGRSVLIEQPWGAPRVGESGAAVAGELGLSDPVADTALRLVQEVSRRTGDEVGDGTVTATVLAWAILREGIRQIAAGASPVSLKTGIDAATALAVERIGSMTRVLGSREEYERVAAHACGVENLAAIVAEAMDRVGTDGPIAVEEGKSIETEWEVVDGMSFDRGYLSPHFLRSGDQEALEIVLENPLILLHDKKISAVQDLLPALQIASESGRPALVIAEDVEGDALATMIVNNQKGVLRCAAVKAPAYGDRRREMLQDLAVLTGGVVISGDAGMSLEAVREVHLGTAKRVHITKDLTTLVDGAGSDADIEGRKNEIKAQIDRADSDYDREKLQERLHKLSGGVAVIRVGAATEPAMKERKSRAEKAVSALRAAASEGVVPGGGVAYLRAAQALENWEGSGLTAEQFHGAEVLRRALREPTRRIAENAGEEGPAVVARVEELEGSSGYDARGDRYGDMVAFGIEDAAKVLRVALQNAASIAGLLLTTEALVTELPGEAPESPGGADMGGMGMPGMGGMPF